jgi:hypothetical protein
MWERFSRRNGKVEEKTSEKELNQGVYYFYLIIGLQLAFVFGLLTTIMLIGKVIATPLWVFLLAFVVGAAGVVYIYRKAKRQFQKFREALSKVDLSGQNYEISVMGGMLTMRVEQNPRRLLQAPANSLIDQEPIETPAAH